MSIAKGATNRNQPREGDAPPAAFRERLLLKDADVCALRFVWPPRLVAWPCQPARHSQHHGYRNRLQPTMAGVGIEPTHPLRDTGF